MLMQLYVVIDNIDTSLSVNRFQVELGTFYSYLYNTKQNKDIYLYIYIIQCHHQRM